MENILSKIKSVKLCMMAHPDNEQDSEFEDRISDLEEIENMLSKNGWINVMDEHPTLNEENHSENVLAICKGQLMVMCYCYNPSEDESERGFFWSNCNGQIEGDAEFDDEYDVTFWQYLPSIVGFVA